MNEAVSWHHSSSSRTGNLPQAPTGTADVCPVTMTKAYLKIARAVTFVTFFLFCRSLQIFFHAAFHSTGSKEQACSDFVVTANQVWKFGILPNSANEYKKPDKLKLFPKHVVDCCFAGSSGQKIVGFSERLPAVVALPSCLCCCLSGDSLCCEAND